MIVYSNREKTSLRYLKSQYEKCRKLITQTTEKIMSNKVSYLCMMCFDWWKPKTGCQCKSSKPEEKKKRTPRYTYEIRLWDGMGEVFFFDLDETDRAKRFYLDALKEHKENPDKVNYDAYFDIKRYDRYGEFEEFDLDDPDLAKRALKKVKPLLEL